MLSRPVFGLALAPPVALATSRRRSHLRTAITSSVMIVVYLSVGVSIGSIGLPCAILTAGAVVGFWFGATRSRMMRRCLDRYAAWGDRARREGARLQAVGPAARARRNQYNELRDLVEETERAAPFEAQRLELQELLEHFVQLSAWHQRSLESLRASGEVQASLTQLSDGAPATHRREIAARRLGHREGCTTRLEMIADELDAADELIRLVAQRVACANLPPSIDLEIGKRLAQLDEALGQLSG